MVRWYPPKIACGPAIVHGGHVGGRKECTE